MVSRAARRFMRSGGGGGAGPSFPPELMGCPRLVRYAFAKIRIVASAGDSPLWQKASMGTITRSHFFAGWCHMTFPASAKAKAAICSGLIPPVPPLIASGSSPPLLSYCLLGFPQALPWLWRHSGRSFFHLALIRKTFAARRLKRRLRC